jgi:hypothetical protein
MMNYWYMFWINSSRGTDSCIIVTYSIKPNRRELKEDLERWCSKFGAWESSENIIRYGWKPVKKISKKIATKQYQKSIKIMFKANKRSKIYSAFMRPYNIKLVRKNT